jgi:putative transposase
MARLARIVIPGVPHHVTQRGNGRQPTFFSDGDYRRYLDLLARHCADQRVSIDGWVLMPNHVHLILTPRHEDGIRAAMSKVHRSYAGHIHLREGRCGHFWQGRFGCVAMDGAHLAAAIRYIVLNPVRARLVAQARDWRWSSLHAHLDPTRSDGVTDIALIAQTVPDVAALVAAGEDEALSLALRRSETIGRPLGDDAFLDRIAALTGRDLRPAKRGRKPAAKSALSPN